jgi:hypothetical protein
MENDSQFDINEIYSKAHAKLTPKPLSRQDRIDLALKFRSAMSPVYDNYHIDSILENPTFKQYEQNQRRKDE